MPIYPTCWAKTARAIILTALPLCTSLHTYAWDTSPVLSASIGAFENEVYSMTLQSSSANTASSTINLSASNNVSYRLAWGLQEDTSRFLLEYYRADMDMSHLSQNRKSTSESLYYSGYWTPTLLFGVKGILGAGIGYSNQRFKSIEDGINNKNFKANGLAYKFSMGAEYEVLPKLDVFFLVEQHKFNDDSDIANKDPNADVTLSRSIPKTKLASFNIGVNYAY